MSQIGWVNFGRQEAEAVQALIGALTDSNARDELGLGTIRDGFSDLLFPGTSTVQTRLRYFVLLPGLFQKVVAKGGDAATALREVETQLIEDFLAKPDLDLKGLIGSEAKGALKRMPSAVYWSGLGAWQIRLPEWRRATPVEVIEAMRQGRTCWAEFSGKAGDGFALSPDERDWVIEKIAALASVQGGTLLGHLVQRGKNNEHTAPDLRALPGSIDPGPRIAEQLSQALDFSQLKVPGMGKPYFHAHFPKQSKDQLWRPGPYVRLAVISPFCDAAGLKRLGSKGPERLVACDDWLAKLGDQRPKLCQVLNSNLLPEADDENIPDPEARSGLHAKLFIRESGDRTYVTLGSGNATGAGLNGTNVEVFVTLSGKSGSVVLVPRSDELENRQVRRQRSRAGCGDRALPRSPYVDLSEPLGQQYDTAAHRPDGALPRAL